MKRKSTGSEQASKVKRLKETLPDYCDTTCRNDQDGNILWPAAREAIFNARELLKEWWVQAAYHVRSGNSRTDLFTY